MGHSDCFPRDDAATRESKKPQQQLKSEFEWDSAMQKSTQEKWRGSAVPPHGFGVFSASAPNVHWRASHAHPDSDQRAQLKDLRAEHRRLVAENGASAHHHNHHSDHTNGAPGILETADRWTASSGDLVSIMKQEMWKERNASTGSMSSLGGDHQHHHHHHHHHRQHHNSSVATGVGRPRHGDLA